MQMMPKGEKELNHVTWVQPPKALLGGSMHGSCGTLILPLESQCRWMKEFEFAEPTSSLRTLNYSSYMYLMVYTVKTCSFPSSHV